MLLLRRFLAVILTLFVLVNLLATLVAFRTSGTFLESDFYVEELQSAEAYSFTHEKLLPAAVEEVMAEVEQPLGLQITSDEIVQAVRRVAPQEWVQEQVEETLAQVIPYIAGKEETFQVTILLRERVDLALGEFTELAQSQVENIHAHVFETLIPEEIDQRINEQGELPLGLELTGAELAERLKPVVPVEWIQEQIGQTVDQVESYLTSRSENFQVNIPLTDRADASLEVTKEILGEAALQEFLFDEVITPAVTQNVGSSVTLPFGVTITDDEIIAALKQVATEEWLDQQVRTIIDGVAPYVTGREEHFQVTIRFEDRRDVALDAVRDLAQTKLEQIIGGLRSCQLNELLEQAARLLEGQLPQCAPPGIDLGEAVRQFDVAGVVAVFIGTQLPLDYTFSDVDLRQVLGPDSQQLLDEARELIRQGWNYTDTDLRQDLKAAEEQNLLDLLDDLRETVDQGWNFTEVDLRDSLAETEEGADALAILDRFRQQAGNFQLYSYLGIVTLGILLGAVGTLGGRSWAGRVGWAGGALAVSALIMYVVAVSIYASQVEPRIQDTFVDARVGREGAELLIVNKASAILESVAEGFISGVANSAGLVLIFGLLGLGGSLAWPMVNRRLRSWKKSPRCSS